MKVDGEKPKASPEQKMGEGKTGDGKCAIYGNYMNKIVLSYLVRRQCNHIPLVATISFLCSLPIINVACPLSCGLAVSPPPIYISRSTYTCSRCPAQTIPHLTSLPAKPHHNHNPFVLFLSVFLWTQLFSQIYNVC